MDAPEIGHEDFTPERFGRLFERVLAEGGICLNAAHFFATWRLWLELKLARCWGNESCVLGAIISPDLFSQKTRAQVVFWFALPEVRHGDLTKNVFRTFEKAMRETDAVDIQVASHEAITPELRAANHIKNGFRKTETIFTKELS